MPHLDRTRVEPIAADVYPGSGWQVQDETELGFSAAQSSAALQANGRDLPRERTRVVRQNVCRNKDRLFPHMPLFYKLTTFSVEDARGVELLCEIPVF
jgi:hypothetical protein